MLEQNPATPWRDYFDPMVKESEKLVLKAYPDPKTGGAPWTCGWGCTGSDIGPNTVWTEAYAQQRFDAVADKFGAMVDAAVTIYLDPWEKAAVTSILYNVGPGSATKDGIVRLKSGEPSTLLRKLNAGDKPGASLEFLKWISPGTNVTNGLKRRRCIEKVLFDTGTYNP
jgi:lysozyme